MRKINLDAERIFENRKSLGEDVRSAQSKYYWATQLPIESHKQATLSIIMNKNVLEIGCSSGYDAEKYVKSVKRYIGVDISDQAIRCANKLKLSNAEFICVDGHNLPTPDLSVDCVIVSSLLHHLDLQKSFSEIYRVLKDDGILIFREPLATNPFFQLYRHISQSARTADERPFTFGDLALMEKYFILEKVHWFGFTSILSAFIKTDSARSFFTHVDNALSKTPLKYFYWQFAGFAKKR
ncbi:class I SAM-dependent methyltransferase [bacterium]|nr:class I SAM-dependent methyltransferase [bacterium]